MVEKFLNQRIEAFQPYHVTKGMTYEDGLMLLTAIRFYQITKDPSLVRFLKNYLEFHIDPQGKILNYAIDEYNIDNILAGNTLFFMADLTRDPRYAKAVSLLRSQLMTHPRTISGSFWHKQRYPFQIWLDGLYMGQVFYLNDAIRRQDSPVYADVMNQVENVRKYLWVEEKKLYVHAYDEKKAMQWANPATGQSPNVWSRSVGWFAMALADLGELFHQIDGQASKRIGALLKELLDGMLPHRDPEYHMWYQLVEKPQLPGNYLETSGTAMLAYAMLKGTRLGMLEATYGALARKTLIGIDQKYLRNEEGTFSLGGTCKVAGLDNERRNGSDEYYLSEPVVANEVKGVCPYFFAQAELRLASAQK